MKLLALDTSTEACSVALQVNHEILSRFELQKNQQSKLLLPMIEGVLSEAQMTLSSLDAIAFGAGPGSFTGLRIAASVTQGVALAHDLPVIPVSSLQTMAQTAYQEFHYKKVLAAIDAHVQAFYYGIFVWNEEKQYMDLINQECLMPPQEWHCPEGEHWEYVGTGWHYLNKTQEHLNYYPKASAMLSIAQKMFETHQCKMPEEALPTYLYEWEIK